MLHIKRYDAKVKQDDVLWYGGSMSTIQIVVSRRCMDVCLADIKFIERRNRKIAVITMHKEYLINESLVHILNRLPDCFVRCHTGYIVNIHEILCIHGNYIILKDNMQLPVGRAYKNGLNIVKNKIKNI